MKSTYMKRAIIAFVLFYGVAAVLIYISTKSEEKIEIKNDLEMAQGYFSLMVDTRRWNAEHGNVYVKPNHGLQPNKYLRDNILKIDENNSLIRINPAWMTRQISEISQGSHHVSFKITSLEPVNPKNKPTPFEAEALRYFETHPNQEYYYMYSDDANGRNLQFMGALRTEKVCLQCHDNYKTGDIRGGIRITVPRPDSGAIRTSHIASMAILLFIVTLLYLFVLLQLRQCEQR